MTFEVHKGDRTLLGMGLFVLLFYRSIFILESFKNLLRFQYFSIVLHVVYGYLLYIILRQNEVLIMKLRLPVNVTHIF